MQNVGVAEKKWMEFFDNPNAYWDNRQNKRNPRAPDFKHKDEKDTVLWLDSRDTPSCKSLTFTVQDSPNVCDRTWRTSYYDSDASFRCYNRRNSHRASAFAQCCMHVTSSPACQGI